LSVKRHASNVKTTLLIVHRGAGDFGLRDASRLTFDVSRFTPNSIIKSLKPRVALTS